MGFDMGVCLESRLRVVVVVELVKGGYASGALVDSNRFEGADRHACLSSAGRMIDAIATKRALVLFAGWHRSVDYLSCDDVSWKPSASSSFA